MRSPFWRLSLSSLYHDAIFSALKTEDHVLAKIALSARRFAILFIVFFGITTLYTFSLHVSP